MKIIKNNAFTLGEVLMAILVVGIVAVLVIPSISRSINAKSKMSLLKNTVSSVTNVVQKELSRARTDDVTMTNIYNNPKAFLEEFDIARSGEAFASSYRKITGNTKANVTIPKNEGTTQAKALLKNGVGIGLVNNLYGKDATGVIIDLNGDNKPNVVGEDYFVFQISWSDDASKNGNTGIHNGDVGGYFNGGSGDANSQESSASLKTACKGGNGAACYRMVELSGFDPEYLEK